MKRLFVFILSLVAVLFVIRIGGDRLLEIYHERTFTTSSEARVNSVLELVQEYGSNPTAAFQTAMALWYRGSPFLPNNEDSRNVELGFVTWLNQGKIYKELRSFSIDRIEHEIYQDEPRVIVSCTINGSPRRIGVTRNQPLEWLK